MDPKSANIHPSPRWLSSTARTVSNAFVGRALKVAHGPEPGVRRAVRAPPATGSPAYAAAAKAGGPGLASRAAGDEPAVAHGLSMVEKDRSPHLHWPASAKLEATNTAIKHSNGTGRGFINARNCKTRIPLSSVARTCGLAPEQHEHPLRQNVHH